MKRLGMGIGALGLLVLIFLFFPFFSVLKVTTVKNGKELFCAKMAEGEEFTLSFIHSVNKRPIFDMIRREGNHFVIVKSRFDSFGAGMPEASTDRGKLQVGRDGWMEWIVNQRVPEITFFVGWVANHSLKIKGREIALVDLAEPGTLLALTIRKSSYYDLWRGGCMK